LNSEGIIQMIAIRNLVVFVAFAAAAQAGDLEGNWKLAVGAQAPCALVLAPDGNVTTDCATGNRVARWRAQADKLELRTASGETVGILTAKDGSYAGKRFSDGKTLVLSR
jgi:hypothetical protein